MRIYNICDHCTISVVKHVQLQKMLGHETMVCYNKCGIPRFASAKCGMMFKPPNLHTVSHFMGLCDIVMIHTSISSTKLLEVDTKGKPVIWNCHDWIPDAATPYYDKISACIVPSEGYKYLLRISQFPITVIYRKLALQDWPKWSKDRINCTIMAGVVSDDPKQPFRDYSFASLALNGRMVVQSAQLPSMMAEKYLTMETVEPDTMLKRLSMFDTSWCGSGNENADFHTVMNNKFHESIAAGAVPILYNSNEMSEYADKHECGITWQGEYPSQSQLSMCRKQIRHLQSEHCLESEVPKLRGIFSDLLSRAK